MIPTEQEFSPAYTYAVSTRFSDLGFPKCIATCVQSSVYLRRRYTHQYFGVSQNVLQRVQSSVYLWRRYTHQ